MKRKLIITDDSEKFTESKCDCDFCKSVHTEYRNWLSYTPKTKKQKIMKDAVDKIENKYKK